MNKKLWKLLMLLLIVGFIGSTFAGCLSKQSNTSGQKLGGVKETSNINSRLYDISYASQSEKQKLDIYMPDEGEGPFPVIIAIHGGGFAWGDKRGGNVIPMLQGLNHGYAVVTVNYRLSDEAKFPAAINDVKATIRFIRVNAAQYNLNPNKIALWGDSAGGNLAALAGTTGGTNNCYNTSLGNADVSDNVTAVIDWYGPTNFSTIDEQNRVNGISRKLRRVQTYNTNDSFISRYLGRNISEVPDLCEQADPATYISSECPPFLVQHGTLDRVIPAQQSTDFAAAIAKEAGQDKVTITLIEGAGHGGEEFETADNMATVFEFLDKYMK